MQALILAAGRGSRMGYQTQDKPKCLTNLSGRTLLEWQTSALKVAGIKNISVIGGYRNELLRPFVDVGYINNQWDQTNSVGSLLVARDFLRKNNVIVSYSDIVYHPDIIRAILKSPGLLSITYDEYWYDLWRVRSENPLDDAETFLHGGGTLKAIGKKAKSLAEIKGQFMGIVKLTPESWVWIDNYLSELSEEVINKLDTTALLSALVCQGRTISVVPVYGRWCEVDTEYDRLAYDRALSAPDKWSHDWRW